MDESTTGTADEAAAARDSGTGEQAERRVAQAEVCLDRLNQDREDLPIEEMHGENRAEQDEHQRSSLARRRRVPGARSASG